MWAGRSERQARRVVDSDDPPDARNSRALEPPWSVVGGRPRLKLSVHGEQARRIARREQIQTVPPKHFLHEDQAPAVAQHIAELARR